jgi:hypothetical protein
MDAATGKLENPFHRHSTNLPFQPYSAEGETPTDILEEGPLQDSEAELFKKKYRQRTTTTSGQSTPTERRRILEPSMKEIYGVCLDISRGVEEKKLKKRAKKQPQTFANQIHNNSDSDDSDDDDDSSSDNTSDSNDDSTSEPSTEDNAQTDLEIEALQDQLQQMMDVTPPAAVKRVKPRKQPNAPFELKMDHATLLEKRRKNLA